MTPAQRAALEWFKPYVDRWGDRPSPVSSATAGGLVRRGWLRSTLQSERVRGERRTTWSLYKITPEGLAALEAPT